MIFATAACLGQGVFYFSNVGINHGARAPIYGPEPANPSLQLWGNTPDASPPGTQTYSGALVAGTNYSVQAWYSLTPSPDVFQLLAGARPVSGALLRFGSPGFFGGGDPQIPDPNLSPTNGYPFYVYLQVRAWDNGGGQYPTWSDAWNAANQGSGHAVGWSKVFYQPLASPINSPPAPGLINFESFNLFIVPEPTTTVLLLIGGAAYFGFQRRRSRRDVGDGRLPSLHRTGLVLLSGVFALLSVRTSSGQGFVFVNTGANFGARAPIYGPEGVNASLQLWGNTPDGVPPGDQTYSGRLVIGTNYSVEAWYSLTPVANIYQLLEVATPVTGSLTTFNSPGFFFGGSRLIPDANLSSTPGYPFYVNMQVRAWDNAGGQYSTWSQAWSAANQGGGHPVGWSKVFYQPLQSQTSGQPWPALINFESFNLFIVPEPTTDCLSFIVLGVFWVFRRSRGHGVCLRVNPLQSTAMRFLRREEIRGWLRP